MSHKLVAFVSSKSEGERSGCTMTGLLIARHVSVSVNSRSWSVVVASDQAV